MTPLSTVKNLNALVVFNFSMTSYDFQERAQKIREIYDNNDKSIPDVLTVLRLLDVNTSLVILGFTEVHGDKFVIEISKKKGNLQNPN